MSTDFRSRMKLSIDVELTKGFDLISEEFRPERHWACHE